MIKQLDNEVASRIAAGEVIERPSSVAKELIENSIDASASTVVLLLEQGGKASFVIEDDGIGIPFNELPLALERYATSKISDLDDLEKIATLGYRGEALSSVAAVSRMEIRSREPSAQSGGVIRCEGGVITLHAETPCQPGTRIQADDLFFNLPARRKFLKSASAELRRILQIVNDHALFRVDMTFRVFSDDKKILDLPPAGSTERALARRWGEDAAVYSSSLSLGSSSARIWWNPIPDCRRTTITLFVNGRRIQDSTVRAAICGGDSVPYGEWLVFLSLPPSEHDVNIHPTKEEVRFKRSGDIYRLIYNAARDVFRRKHSFHSGSMAQGTLATDPVHRELRNAPRFDATDPMFSAAPWAPAVPAESAADRVAAPDDTVFVPAGSPREGPSAEEWSYIGQTSAGFLIFDLPNGVALVDPHAAHERINYEEIELSFKEGVAQQRLAIPAEIPPSLIPEVGASEEELRKLSFSFENGLLTGVPMLKGRSGLSPLDMLRSALRGIETEKDPTKRNREVWWRIARLACRDAVKLGQRLEKEEALSLINRLRACRDPFACPHGRPTIFLIENKKLEDWFER